METSQQSQSPEPQSRRSSISYADPQEQVADDEVCKHIILRNYSNCFFIALWCIWWLSLYLGSPHQPSTSCLHLHGMWMCCACFNSTQSYHQNTSKCTSSSGQASSQHYHFTRKYSVSVAITSGIYCACFQRLVNKIWISMPYLWRYVQYPQIDSHT